MKNLYQRLKNLGKGLLVTGGLFALLSGCTPTPAKNKSYINKDLEGLVTIKGEPLSCEMAVAGHYVSTEVVISIVIKSDGKYILAMRYGGGDMENYVKAAAAVNSEIVDNDNEPITISGRDFDGGKYRGGKYFKIRTVEANGIHANLGEIHNY